MSGSLIGPVDASRLPRIDEVLPSDVAVVGFLFDRGVSNRPGARFGPALDRIRERLGAAPIYVSVDIDVLDPAHAPGTGTPEAGGMTSRELFVMLRALADLARGLRRHRRGRPGLRPRRVDGQCRLARRLRAVVRDVLSREP